MPLEKRLVMGKKARKFVIENLSAEVIGKQIEEIIDNSSTVEWNFESDFVPRNPNHIPLDTEDNVAWVIDLYKNILRMTVDENDDGLKTWISQLNKGVTRDQILSYFRNVGAKENQQNNKIELSDLLDKDDLGRRILFVMPQSAGDVFMSTSLLPSIKEVYPEYNIYFATKPEFNELLNGNPHIHKVLHFTPAMENLLTMEGHAKGEGYFDITFLPHFGTQKNYDYQHNGIDKIQFNLLSSHALT
jgi:hypothetical protein